MTFLGGGRACIGFKFSQLEMSAYCCLSPRCTFIYNTAFAEVVLVMLLAKFTFALSDKGVFWNLAGIQYPTASKDSVHPQLLMKVGFVKSS